MYRLSQIETEIDWRYYPGITIQDHINLVKYQWRHGKQAKNKIHVTVLGEIYLNLQISRIVFLSVNCALLNKVYTLHYLST